MCVFVKRFDWRSMWTHALAREEAGTVPQIRW
jgi:hypothetical protein